MAVDVTYQNLRVLIGNAVFDRYETAVADALIERPHVVLAALIKAHGYGGVMDMLITQFKQED